MKHRTCHPRSHHARAVSHVRSGDRTAWTSHTWASIAKRTKLRNKTAGLARPICSTRWCSVRSCFTLHRRRIRRFHNEATEKPGPFAANVSHWLRRCYLPGNRGRASAAAIRSALDLLEARAQFDAPSARSISASPSMPAGSILILPTSIGVPLTIGPDGWRVLGCPPVRFRRPPGCCRCRYRSAADRSKPCGPSSIFRTRMTLC